MSDAPHSTAGEPREGASEDPLSHYADPGSHSHVAVPGVGSVINPLSDEDIHHLAEGNEEGLPTVQEHSEAAIDDAYETTKGAQAFDPVNPPEGEVAGPGAIDMKDVEAEGEAASDVGRTEGRDKSKDDLGLPQDDDADYDPSDHTVADVNEKLAGLTAAGKLDEADRIMKAERKGKGRSGITG